MSDGSTVDLPAWIARRSAWGAAPAARPAGFDALPYPRLWLHHSVSAPGEAGTVRSIQKMHLGKGWRDIAYSLLVSVKGNTYDGIGVGRRHLNSDAGWSAAVCALGNFETDHPPAPMLEALAQIAAHGFRSGWWAQPGFTGGHRDLSATACPGRHLYAALPTINARALELIGDNDNGEDDMQRWLVRAPNGAVYLFDGATLRPANNPTYRAVVSFHGAQTPDGAPWFDWEQSQIDAVLEASQ